MSSSLKAMPAPSPDTKEGLEFVVKMLHVNLSDELFHSGRVTPKALLLHPLEGFSDSHAASLVDLPDHAVREGFSKVSTILRAVSKRSQSYGVIYVGSAWDTHPDMMTDPSGDKVCLFIDHEVAGKKFMVGDIEEEKGSKVLKEFKEAPVENEFLVQSFLGNDKGQWEH